MAEIETQKPPVHLRVNREEFSIIQRIAASADDGPVLMVNLNRYAPKANFPNGDLYLQYVSGLGPFIEAAGGKILGRLPVFGQAVGDQKIDEMIFAWYPLHKIFANLHSLPGAVENFRLRGLCVEYAVIHRCPDARFSLSSSGE
jgi:hypothetical protein